MKEYEGEEIRRIATKNMQSSEGEVGRKIGPLLRHTMLVTEVGECPSWRNEVIVGHTNDVEKRQR
jgi:hypothetical protein